MSTTFRDGDRVRRKPSGDCGEFLGVLGGGWAAVRFDGMTPDQHVRLSHLEPETPAFKVGDRVEIVAGHLHKGAAGKVAAIRDGDDPYRYSVDLDKGCRTYARQQDLRPIPEEAAEQPPLKAGDRVRVEGMYRGRDARIIEESDYFDGNPGRWWRVSFLDGGSVDIVPERALRRHPEPDRSAAPEPVEDDPVAEIAWAAAAWQQCGQDREVIVHLQGHVVKVTAVVLQGEDPYLVKFLGPIAPEAVAEALDLACLRRCNLTVEVSPSGPDSFAAEDDR